MLVLVSVIVLLAFAGSSQVSEEKENGESYLIYEAGWLCPGDIRIILINSIPEETENDFYRNVYSNNTTAEKLFSYFLVCNYPTERSISVGCTSPKVKYAKVKWVDTLRGHSECSGNNAGPETDGLLGTHCWLGDSAQASSVAQIDSTTAYYLSGFSSRLKRS